MHKCLCGCLCISSLLSFRIRLSRCGKAGEVMMEVICGDDGGVKDSEKFNLLSVFIESLLI